MRKSFFAILADLFVPAPQVVNVDLTEKTIVVVGANTGLGYETTKHFARMKPGRLILGCRDQARGDEAIRRIKEEVGYTAEMWLVDLSDFASTIAFADRMSHALNRLDLLVLNAAVARHTDLAYVSTKDGFEQALQVNVISQALIALRSLTLLNGTAEAFSTRPRIVFVGSEVHHMGDVSEEALRSPNAFRVLGSKEFCAGFRVRMRRYPDTKLLNLFFVRGLSSRLKSQAIIINTVNPGLCHSEIRRDVKGFAAMILNAYINIFARKTEEGSRLIVWACLGGGEEEENLQGAYINLNKVEEPSDFVLGPEGKRREDKLWDDLIDVLVDVDADTQLKHIVRLHCNV